MTSPAAATRTTPTAPAERRGCRHFRRWPAGHWSRPVGPGVSGPRPGALTGCTRRTGEASAVRHPGGMQHAGAPEPRRDPRGGGDGPRCASPRGRATTRGGSAASAGPGAAPVPRGHRTRKVRGRRPEGSATRVASRGTAPTRPLPVALRAPSAGRGTPGPGGPAPCRCGHGGDAVVGTGGDSVDRAIGTDTVRVALSVVTRCAAQASAVALIAGQRGAHALAQLGLEGRHAAEHALGEAARDGRDARRAPRGAARRGCRSPSARSVNDQTVKLSFTRNAISWCGSKRTTLDWVGHTSRPRRLTLSSRVPSWIGRPVRTKDRTTCGLHSAIRGRSETSDHTRAGSAATSTDSSISGSTSWVTAPCADSWPGG